MIKRVLLTIAGSDSGGGAGIQADLKTFEAFGCFGTSVITALTAQSLKNVVNIQYSEPHFFRDQLRSVLENFPVDGIKIGMVGKIELWDIIINELKKFPQLKFCTVVDPVLVATSGASLAGLNFAKVYINEVSEIAGMITPNFPEGISLVKSASDTHENMSKAVDEYSYEEVCKELHRLFPEISVLLKGGHRPVNYQNEENMISDYLLIPGNKDPIIFTDTLIDYDFQFHGTGCTLSSAIAASLAIGQNEYNEKSYVPLKSDLSGDSIIKAVESGRNYVRNAIYNSPENIIESTDKFAKIKVLNHNPSFFNKSI